MDEAKSILHGGLLDILRSKKLVPELTTRCVIDIKQGEVVRVYWQTYADERWLEVLTGDNLGDVKVIRADGPANG